MKRFYISCPGQKFLQHNGSSAKYILPSEFPCHNLPVHQPYTFQWIWLFSYILADFVLNVRPRKNHHHFNRQWLGITLYSLIVHNFFVKNGYNKQLPIFWWRNAFNTIQFTSRKHPKGFATWFARPRRHRTTAPSHKFKEGEMAVAHSFSLP